MRRNKNTDERRERLREAERERRRRHATPKPPPWLAVPREEPKAGEPDCGCGQGRA